MFVLLLIANFATQYRDFLNSPQKDSIFDSLARRDVDIRAYSDNPIILWFWRTNTNDPGIDSMLKKLPIPRNSYLSGVLRWEAKDASNFENAWGKMQLAVHFDSTAIENFLSLAALAIKSKRIAKLMDILSLPILADLKNQVFLIANLQILILLSVFFSILAFIIVKMIYYLPVLSHRLDPLKHYFLKGVPTFIIIMIPALVIRNLYVVFFAYGLLLMIIMNKKEKVWYRLGIIAVLATSLASFTLNHLIPFLKGTSKSYELYRMVYYDSDQRVSAENNFEKELLAIALKQQGAFDEALSVYEELYYNGNHKLLIGNNLANLYALYDEDLKAEELYKTLLNDVDGEPYYNLGLLKLKNLEYLASSEYMGEARKLGYSTLAKEPVDIMPDNKTFYRIIFPGRFELPHHIVPMYFVALLVLFIASFLPFKLSPPFYCSTCGQAICKDCQEETGGEGVCKDCVTKVQSIKDVENADALTTSLGRNKRLINIFLTYIMSILLPGSGLIYQGRHFLGLLITGFAIMVYSLFLLPQSFVEPAGWICLSLQPIFLAVGAIVLLLAHIFSFILLRGSTHAA